MSDTSVSEAGSALGGRGGREGRDPLDPTAELKVKARRRLIGAAVLLLAVVVIVPAVLDPSPRALPDTIPIEIPGEKTPFTPRLSLPPLPEPAPDVSLPVVTPPTLPAAAPSSEKSAEPKKSEAATETKAAEPKHAEAKPAEPKSAEPKSKEPKASSEAKAAERPKSAEAKTKFVLQAAAPASEAAAKELADRITGAGLKSYVTKVEAKDGVRYRVRVGPYTSRDEAERARARLRAAGINANLVAL